MLVFILKSKLVISFCAHNYIIMLLPHGKSRLLLTKEIVVEILPYGRTGDLLMQHIENFKADTIKYAIN